jgi:hypothetical protein
MSVLTEGFHGFLHFIKQIHRQYLVHVDSPFTVISVHSVYSQKSSRLWSGDFCRPLDWASTSCPLLTKSLVQVLSDYVGTPESFGVLRPDQWLKGVTTMSRAGLLGDSHKIRNFLSTHKNNSWKLCWHAWEPYRASVVMITWKLLISQQSGGGGFMCWLGHFCSVKWILPLKSATHFCQCPVNIIQFGLIISDNFINCLMILYKVL